MIIVWIFLQEELVEISNYDDSYVVMGNWTCQKFPTPFFDVSSIETRHPSALAGWHIVRYDLQYAYFLSYVSLVNTEVVL